MVNGWQDANLIIPTDIIANFTEVPSYREMEQCDLCSDCYVNRLALMQSSQYSFYNEYYKAELEYVYSTCDCSGPTEIPPPLEDDQPGFEPYCLSDKRYTTAEGETCESISNCTGVSSAALYMGNQAVLPDCSSIPPGTDLCVPVACETYYVRPSDTCRSIERTLDLDYGTIRFYNSWINSGCSNLQPGTDFYGKLICVSPQGGRFSGVIPRRGLVDAPVRDGYSRTSVPPPSNCAVADGTTRNCGKWHVVEPKDTCATIAMRAGITAKLLRQANPSLAGDSCTKALKPGTAVCVGPQHG